MSSPTPFITSIIRRGLARLPPPSSYNTINIPTCNSISILETLGFVAEADHIHTSHTPPSNSFKPGPQGRGASCIIPVFEKTGPPTLPPSTRPTSHQRLTIRRVLNLSSHPIIVESLLFLEEIGGPGSTAIHSNAPITSFKATATSAKPHPPITTRRTTTKPIRQVTPTTDFANFGEADGCGGGAAVKTTKKGAEKNTKTQKEKGVGGVGVRVSVKRVKKNVVLVTILDGERVESGVGAVGARLSRRGWTVGGIGDVTVFTFEEGERERKGVVGVERRESRLIISRKGEKRWVEVGGRTPPKANNLPAMVGGEVGEVTKPANQPAIAIPLIETEEKTVLIKSVAPAAEEAIIASSKITTTHTTSPLLTPTPQNPTHDPSTSNQSLFARLTSFLYSIHRAYVAGTKSGMGHENNPQRLPSPTTTTIPCPTDATITSTAPLNTTPTNSVPEFRPKAAAGVKLHPFNPTTNPPNNAVAQVVSACNADFNEPYALLKALATAAAPQPVSSPPVGNEPPSLTRNNSTTTTTSTILPSPSPSSSLPPSRRHTPPPLPQPHPTFLPSPRSIPPRPQPHPNYPAASLEDAWYVLRALAATAHPRTPPHTFTSSPAPTITKRESATGTSTVPSASPPTTPSTATETSTTTTKALVTEIRTLVPTLHKPIPDSLHAHRSRIPVPSRIPLMTGGGINSTHPVPGRPFTKIHTSLPIPTRARQTQGVIIPPTAKLATKPEPAMPFWATLVPAAANIPFLLSTSPPPTMMTAKSETATHFWADLISAASHMPSLLSTTPPPSMVYVEEV
ncbi:hypothetical protein HDV00_003617 [Rhizophlyctis rosea]|nr:hypothetical protein HDV00_003617 [Rhizophlyctis rosea]